MKYNIEDFNKYIPDLKKYVRSKIKTDWWKDIVQDTLVYLYLKFENIIITDLKGLIFNTANFFINKHFTSINKNNYIELEEINYLNATDKQKQVFILDKWNGADIDDKLYYNLRKLSKTLYEPFEMQLNDLSIKDISKKLQINENTVKTRIKRCKDILKSGIKN